jgi:hypothetical protein
MADVIRLVSGDSKPVIVLTLSDDATGAAVDLSAATVSVSVRFRKTGGDTLIATIAASNLTDGTDGKVQFDFSGGALVGAVPGSYEGEVVVTTTGVGTQTVFEKLTFRVRDSLISDTATTTTYAVTVASGTNPYGTGNKFYINGAVSPTLSLIAGSTYIFDQSASSNSGHPLRFSSTANGTHGVGGSNYTTGVTVTGTPGNAGANTQIVVSAGAPTLYYYCTNHSGMGGQANTV